MRPSRPLAPAPASSPAPGASMSPSRGMTSTVRPTRTPVASRTVLPRSTTWGPIRSRTPHRAAGSTPLPAVRLRRAPASPRVPASSSPVRTRRVTRVRPPTAAPPRGGPPPRRPAITVRGVRTPVRRRRVPVPVAGPLPRELIRPRAPRRSRVLRTRIRDRVPVVREPVAPAVFPPLVVRAPSPVPVAVPGPARATTPSRPARGWVRIDVAPSRAVAVPASVMRAPRVPVASGCPVRAAPRESRIRIPR